MLIWYPTAVSQHLSKNDKQGWLTRWPPHPRSVANPIWHRQCPSLFTLIIYCAIVFHLLWCSLMVGLLHVMAFMMLCCSVVITDGVENDDELVIEVLDGVKTEVTGRRYGLPERKWPEVSCDGWNSVLTTRFLKVALATSRDSWVCSCKWTTLKKENKGRDA